MPQPNIILIVIDTLRFDYATKLDLLQRDGFTKCDNAIAPSSWTLPSHVSIFTGKLPSSHGVHESLGVYATNIAGIAQTALRSCESNLLEVLRERGYRSYCYTSNPFVTPRFGFEFDFCQEFDSTGEVVRVVRHHNVRTIGTVAFLLKSRRLNLLFQRVASRVKHLLLSNSSVPVLEKGSAHILKDLRKATFAEPFFLFVNLMECHEPYFWNEKDWEKLIGRVILGLPLRVGDWKSAYRTHANLAISRTSEIVKLVSNLGDPLIIVTSDHGQLLGEGGLFGHGYYLDDALVKVPLYLKYPRNVKKATKTGSFVSLTELNALILSVSQNADSHLGSNLAFSESYGSTVDLSELAPLSSAAATLEVFARRVRAFANAGSVTYNAEKQVVESSCGEMTDEQIKGLVNEISLVGIGKRLTPTKLSSEDEVVIAERLKNLGYI